VLRRLSLRGLFLVSVVGVLSPLPLTSAAAAATNENIKNENIKKDSAPMTEDAVFAGGCFWCIEADFEKVKGVQSVESGYTGGKEENPTYEQVSSGKTGHLEAVRVVYDPAQVSYRELLEKFWRSIDPTAENRQFCDRGPQYRSAIFYLPAQKKAATDSLLALEDLGLFKKIHTELIARTPFWAAEEYHQDYARRNPIRYKFYRMRCGRDARLEKVWSKQHP